MARPTHIGNTTYGFGRVLVGVGDDPDAPTGDAPTPEDVAPESTVEFPYAGVPDFAFVQSKEFGNAATSSGVAVTLDDAPTEGSLLVAMYVVRENAGTDPTLAGWTVLPTSDGVSVLDGGGGDNGGVYLFYKVAVLGESATVTVSKNGSFGAYLAVAEFAGAWTFDASNSESTTSTVTSLGSGSITPAGTPALMVGAIIQSNESTLTIGGGFTQAEQGMTGTEQDFGPTGILGYRYEVSPAGSYEMTATSNISDSYAGIIAAFEGEASSSIWLPAVLVRDADDATFEYVSEEAATEAGAILRLDVGVAQRFASFRLVIGLQDAGSATYTLKGDDNSDFSSPATIAAATFTATGSFTADTVTASWSQSTGYRYYRLVPTTPDDVRIYTFSLYPAPDPGEAIDDHLTDTTDAHDASAISIVDAGTYFAGTNVEAALQELGAGASVSYGSNASHVAEISLVGVASAVARADHYHAGIAQVTASSSNTMQRGTLNLRPGTNTSFALTDTDGDGEFDTITIAGAAAGGGGAIDWGEDADISTLDYDDVADAGVLDEVARADHVHGMPSAGGGVSWETVIDKGGTTFTGFTGVTGTWASDGTTINQTDTAESFRTARCDTKVPSGYPVIFEAEIRWPTTGQPGSSFKYGAILLGNHAVILDKHNNLIRWQDWSSSDRATIAQAFSYDTWYKLRVVYNDSRTTVYLDGTLIGTRILSPLTVAPTVDDFLLLGTYGAIVHFRNIKAYTLSGGDPA